MKTKIGFNVHSYFSKMNDVNFSKYDLRLMIL